MVDANERISVPCVIAQSLSIYRLMNTVYKIDYWLKSRRQLST